MKYQYSILLLSFVSSSRFYVITNLSIIKKRVCSITSKEDFAVFKWIFSDLFENEKWVNHFDPQSKEQSKECKPSSWPRSERSMFKNGLAKFFLQFPAILNKDNDDGDSTSILSTSTGFEHTHSSSIQYDSILSLQKIDYSVLMLSSSFSLCQLFLSLLCRLSSYPSSGNVTKCFIVPLFKCKPCPFFPTNMYPDYLVFTSRPQFLYCSVSLFNIYLSGLLQFLLVICKKKCTKIQPRIYKTF